LGIIVHGDYVNAESDLKVYRTQFNLPACTSENGCFKKVYQDGQGPLPGDAGAGQEIDNDIEMVSAVCPLCHILLVETTVNAVIDDFGKAVNTAVSSGAGVVSISFGFPEETSDPGKAAMYFDHPGVLIVASTGDCGVAGGFCAIESTTTPVQFPAAAKTVLAVGGTNLSSTLDSGRGWTETVWNNSTGSPGSGCSAYESKPSWQTDSGCPGRTLADVSAVATNVAVYTTAPGNSTGWIIYNGTSVAAPVVAGIFAVAGHTNATPQYPYANPSQFFDITEGNNIVDGRGACTPAAAYLCTAGAGYDGPTGMGSPDAAAIAAAPPIPSISVANIMTIVESVLW
jgi:subtilase family serine protease